KLNTSIAVLAHSMTASSVIQPVSFFIWVASGDPCVSLVNADCPVLVALRYTGFPKGEIMRKMRFILLAVTLLATAFAGAQGYEGTPRRSTCPEIPTNNPVY